MNTVKDITKTVKDGANGVIWGLGAVGIGVMSAGVGLTEMTINPFMMVGENVIESGINKFGKIKGKIEQKKKSKEAKFNDGFKDAEIIYVDFTTGKAAACGRA